MVCKISIYKDETLLQESRTESHCSENTNFIVIYYTYIVIYFEEDLKYNFVAYQE